uniref:Claudin n=1 Tax=Geotrypetes seraphini TaxID=260995 RepID=A0A6P8NRB1_GEOSA|nr:claudin-4-like [Geotrypetes seraphini]XP_033778848.1 claudin-4-like [Geotrypetes seraphini]XP_033778850.1 claudin-4-like [Geotrypetes seraphini]XP_033778851.1 claudin-4-like [Geotrypetes seraphini]XP_033778852.1 claudin-4-like [Geotrypetes seraphini]XP_033778853.1 claudin-4-like [Geotrypetes seraphini]
MAALGLQLVGVALGVLGLIFTILCCLLPMWRVTAFIGSNIVTAQVFWEGLWMDCVSQNTGQLQCKVYDSMLQLSADLQAARALVVISIAVSLIALLISIVGAECSNCVEDRGVKCRISIVAGAIFILAGIIVLVPVSWSANYVIRTFYNPVVPDALKRELGASLYVGWTASLMLIIGGALLCSSCPPKEGKSYPVTYKAMRTPASTNYSIRNYV